MPDSDPDPHARENARTVIGPTVMTPRPEGSAAMPFPSSQATIPRNTSAFAGVANPVGMSSTLAPSVPMQNLLEDKLIMSAPRTDLGGRQVPILGGIHLLAKLGQGGMGAVYYGIHPRLQQEVAVKVLPFHLAESTPGLVQRFIREAQIAAKVRSPHLVGVIDVNEENGLFYLVMEFVSGKSAGELLRSTVAAGEKGLSENEALQVCIGATTGLAAAHAHGVIHRDIKPDNIMVPRKIDSSTAVSAEPPSVPAVLDFIGAKLADLGLARNETVDLSMTAANACMGTPGFMSPEQANDAKHASKPADVFSMGATLYALLAGDSPFKGTSLMQMLNLTVNQPHAPIGEVRPGITRRTSNLLDRCLAKKEEDRYPDASALLKGLRDCYDDEADIQRTFVYGSQPLLDSDPAILAASDSSEIAAAPSSVAEPSFHEQPRKSSNWLPAVAAITVLVLGAAGTGGYFIMQKVAQEREHIASDLKQRDALAAQQKQVAEEKLHGEMRQAAYQEELRMIDDWRKAQNATAEEVKQTFAAVTLTAEEFRREKNYDKAIAVLENTIKQQSSAGNHPSRLNADALLKEIKEDRNHAVEAFSTALKTAQELKKEQNIDKALSVLEEGFKTLGTLTHTGRVSAELLLRDLKNLKKQSLDAFSASIKTASDQRKALNWDAASATLEDALKSLGTQPHDRRAEAETMLKDIKDDKRRTLDAFEKALAAATEFQRARKWDGVATALEAPLKALGTLSTLNRPTAEYMLKEAKDQKERQKKFAAELEKANDAIKLSSFEAAKTALDTTVRKLAQDPAETAALNDALVRANAGIHKMKLTLGRSYMSQGRALRPDLNPRSKLADWYKASEAFKSAASIFLEIEEKDDLARADTEEADCLRKDNNPKTGDWAQAAGLYQNAALLFGVLNDKRNQADTISRHAACLDTALNPAGDIRQAAFLYGRAATFFGDAGNKKGMADNLFRQGLCISKEKMNPVNAERAADIFKRAAAIYEELVDKKSQGVCIYNQAFCMIKEKKMNMTPEARALFARAAKLCRDAGDETTSKLAEELLR